MTLDDEGWGNGWLLYRLAYDLSWACLDLPRGHECATVPRADQLALQIGVGEDRRAMCWIERGIRDAIDRRPARR